jgi:hypothetical protein
MKLDVKAFALTCALMWGLGLPLATWWMMAFEGASRDPTWLGHFYRGYSFTVTGRLIGAAWAFFDALIGGAIFAWLYDFFAGRATHKDRRMAA